MDERLPRLRAILTTTPARWTNLTTAIPDDLMHRAPAPGEWSAFDCLRHLRDVENAVFQARVQAFRAGEELVSYDPEKDSPMPGGESASALAADFARLRNAGLALLDEVRPEELALTVSHPEYGAVRLGELLNYWAAHDLVHTVQAERALMQSFIARTGPWSIMLAEHDAAARPG